MSDTYFYVSTLAFLVLSIIWSSTSWLNVSIKFTLIALTIAGTVLSLMSLGFVIKG